MNKREASGRLQWMIAVSCFVIAAYFKFALLGYTVLALAFFAAGCLLFLFYGLKRLEEKHTKNSKKAKQLKNILIVSLVIGIIGVVLIEIPIVSHAKTDEHPGANYIIVLGAGVNGSTPSLTLRNRLMATFDYLIEYPEAIAIVSGGRGNREDITEAEAMRIWLEEKGIAPERIVKEELAANTQENITFSLEKIRGLGEEGNVRAAIVSSEYHLYRAKYLAKHAGIEPVGVAAETTLPVLKLNYFLREALAVLKMWVLG